MHVALVLPVHVAGLHLRLRLRAVPGLQELEKDEGAAQHGSEPAFWVSRSWMHGWKKRTGSQMASTAPTEGETRWAAAGSCTLAAGIISMRGVAATTHSCEHIMVLTIHSYDIVGGPAAPAAIVH
jgi:hypothetical protein